MAPVLTPWAPVVINLAMAVLYGGDNVLNLGSRTLYEQLKIDVMEGLKPKASGSGVWNENDHVAISKVDTSGSVRTQLMLLHYRRCSE